MLQLIIGDKGKGKTTKMLERANNENKISSGSIIYVDKSNKHMYELSNAIKLINLNNFSITNKDAFVGFIQGLISILRDTTHIFLDNFMQLANIDANELTAVLDEMAAISDKYDLTFVISTSVNETQLDPKYADNIICKL